MSVLNKLFFNYNMYIVICFFKKKKQHIYIYSGGLIYFHAGLKRCGKSCRLRWLNYLRPGIKRGNITNDEEELIIRLHNLLGNRYFNFGCYDKQLFRDYSVTDLINQKL